MSDLRILAVIAFVVTACSSEPVEPQPRVASVTISPDTATINIGDSKEFEAQLLDEEGTLLVDRPVSWVSLNEDIAVVDSTGLVKGKSAGPTLIQATSDGQADTASVLVLGPVASVSVAPDSTTILVGETHQFTAAIRDELGSELKRSVVWESSDETLLAVDSVGLVTGFAEGTAFVYATVEGMADSASVRVFPPLTFTGISAGSVHCCGLTADSAAFCWGANAAGKLGNDTTVLSAEPVRVGGELQFATLDAGNNHNCSLRADGSAWCWGSNSVGQLGDGTTVSFRALPDSVASALPFVELSVGGDHACGLTASGDAYCWGRGETGQLGDSSTVNRNTPVLVLGGLSFATVSAGGEHTCAVITGGQAYCWGRNDRGQLGDSTQDSRISPVPVAGGVTFSVISAGENHTCAITPAGSAYCWGANGSGGLGDGTQQDRFSPSPVSGGLSFTAITAGTGLDSNHTCGAATDGMAYCWGSNWLGQLGDGSRVDRLAPVAVFGGLEFTSITAGRHHTCGLTSAPIGYCWGWGEFGQLGNGSRADFNVPSRVFGQP